MAKGRFALDVTKFIEASKIKAEDVVRGIAYGLAGNIVLNTPVDTGRARGNWICTTDKLVKQRTGIFDKVGDKTLDRIALQLEDYTVEETKNIYLSNTLPYIIMLEYGWSQQSPAGMMRLALINFNGVRVQSLFGSFRFTQIALSHT